LYRHSGAVVSVGKEHPFTGTEALYMP
jgi:hypothetical protein